MPTPIPEFEAVPWKCLTVSGITQGFRMLNSPPGHVEL